MKECKHNWSHELTKDNGHRLIEIYWCTKCGAFKRREIYQGGPNKEYIKKPGYRERA